MRLQYRGRPPISAAARGSNSKNPYGAVKGVFLFLFFSFPLSLNWWFFIFLLTQHIEDNVYIKCGGVFCLVVSVFVGCVVCLSV